MKEKGQWYDRGRLKRTLKNQKRLLPPELSTQQRVGHVPKSKLDRNLINLKYPRSLWGYKRICPLRALSTTMVF